MFGKCIRCRALQRVVSVALGVDVTASPLVTAVDGPEAAAGLDVAAVLEEALRPVAVGFVLAEELVLRGEEWCGKLWDEDFLADLSLRPPLSLALAPEAGPGADAFGDACLAAADPAEDADARFAAVVAPALPEDEDDADKDEDGWADAGLERRCFGPDVVEEGATNGETAGVDLSDDRCAVAIGEGAVDAATLNVEAETAVLLLAILDPFAAAAIRAASVS